MIILALAAATTISATSAHAQASMLPIVPIAKDEARSLCATNAKNLTEPCYCWALWGPEKLWITRGQTKLAIRVVDDAVMFGYYTVIDIDIVSSSRASIRIQRREYDDRNGVFSLSHVGARYAISLTPGDIEKIVHTFEDVKFWSLPSVVQPGCLDGSYATIEAIEVGKHTIVDQNIACDDSRSGIGPLDTAVREVLSNKLLPK